MPTWTTQELSRIDGPEKLRLATASGTAASAPALSNATSRSPTPPQTSTPPSTLPTTPSTAVAPKDPTDKPEPEPERAR